MAHGGHQKILAFGSQDQRRGTGGPRQGRPQRHGVRRRAGQRAEDKGAAAIQPRVGGLQPRYLFAAHGMAAQGLDAFGQGRHGGHDLGLGASQVHEQASRRQERLDGLNRLGIARTGPVKYIGTAIVLAPDADTQAQLSDLADELDPNVRRQSELAAEDKVVEALIAEGFPQDRIERVGHLKLGFDIRAHRISDAATGEVFVKRIEVKGRMRGQPVRLTTNEWYKAQQLAETYWLYVVWDPLGDSPKMVRIQNPVVKLDHAKREIVAARFYEISADAVQQAAARNP